MPQSDRVAILPRDSAEAPNEFSPPTFETLHDHQIYMQVGHRFCPTVCAQEFVRRNASLRSRHRYRRSRGSARYLTSPFPPALFHDTAPATHLQHLAEIGQRVGVDAGRSPGGRWCLLPAPTATDSGRPRPDRNAPRVAPTPLAHGSPSPTAGPNPDDTLNTASVPALFKRGHLGLAAAKRSRTTSHEPCCPASDQPHRPHIHPRIS